MCLVLVVDQNVSNEYILVLLYTVSIEVDLVHVPGTVVDLVGPTSRTMECLRGSFSPSSLLPTVQYSTVPTAASLPPSLLTLCTGALSLPAATQARAGAAAAVLSALRPAGGHGRSLAALSLSLGWIWPTSATSASPPTRRRPCPRVWPRRGAHPPRGGELGESDRVGGGGERGTNDRSWGAPSDIGCHSRG